MQTPPADAKLHRRITIGTSAAALILLAALTAAVSWKFLAFVVWVVAFVGLVVLPLYRFCVQAPDLYLATLRVPDSYLAPKISAPLSPGPGLFICYGPSSDGRGCSSLVSQCST